MSAEMKAQLQFHFMMPKYSNNTVILLLRMFCLMVKQKLLFVYSMQVKSSECQKSLVKTCSSLVNKL